MKKYVIIFLALSLVILSCKKDKKDSDYGVEKKSYPGRVKTIRAENETEWNFFYDSEGFLTVVEVDYGDKCTFVWDRSAHKVRIIAENNFYGLKKDITFMLTDDNLLSHSIGNYDEKFTYDSLSQITKYTCAGTDTSTFVWADGNVLSKTVVHYAGDTLQFSRTYNYTYSTKEEKRNFGINCFPTTGVETKNYLTMLGFATKNIVEHCVMTNNLTGEEIPTNCTNSFDATGRITSIYGSGPSSGKVYYYSYY